MRFFPILFAGILLSSSLVGWGTDFENAKKRASEEHKLILLNFSGSDWCGPCIKLHDEIFESATFKSFADGNLILINADFPRLKKISCQKTSRRRMTNLQINLIRRVVFPTPYYWMQMEN